MNATSEPTDQEVVVKALREHTLKLEDMILLLWVSLRVASSSGFDAEKRAHHQELIEPRISAVKAQIRAIARTATRLKP